MLRVLRPDLLCGLGGFMLGAAALLLIHQAAAHKPQPPVPHTDVLALTTSGPVAARANAG